MDKQSALNTAFEYYSTTKMSPKCIPSQQNNSSRGWILTEELSKMEPFRLTGPSDSFDTSCSTSNGDGTSGYAPSGSATLGCSGTDWSGSQEPISRNFLGAILPETSCSTDTAYHDVHINGSGNVTRSCNFNWNPNNQPYLPKTSNAMIYYTDGMPKHCYSSSHGFRGYQSLPFYNAIHPSNGSDRQSNCECPPWGGWSDSFHPQNPCPLGYVYYCRKCKMPTLIGSYQSTLRVISEEDPVDISELNSVGKAQTITQVRKNARRESKRSPYPSPIVAYVVPQWKVLLLCASTRCQQTSSGCMDPTATSREDYGPPFHN